MKEDKGENEILKKKKVVYYRLGQGRGEKRETPVGDFLCGEVEIGDFNFSP
jgi:hypothetical protein